MAVRPLTPLSPEEQAFAAENHDVVIQYLRMRGLDVSDWYDVVIFRFLRSVRRWFTEPQLHAYSFKTIAFYAMRSAIGGERCKQRRRERYEATISLDDVIGGTKGCTYLDTISDPYDQYAAFEEREAIIQVAGTQQRTAFNAEFGKRILQERAQV